MVSIKEATANAIAFASAALGPERTAGIHLDEHFRKITALYLIRKAVGWGLTPKGAR